MSSNTTPGEGVQSKDTTAKFESATEKLTPLISEQLVAQSTLNRRSDTDELLSESGVGGLSTEDIQKLQDTAAGKTITPDFSKLKTVEDQVQQPASDLPAPLQAFDPTQSVAPTSLEEGADIESLIDINTIRDIGDLVNANLQDLQPLLEAEQERRGEATARSDDLATQLQEFIAGRQANLGTPGQITPEQQAAIAQRTEELIGSGSADINEQLQRSLETLREESGGSRGLRFTDTPIFDVAQDVTSSANRDISRLISDARQQQATAELQLPFQAAELDLQQAQQLGSFLSGTRGFEEDLAQRAFSNRAQLFGESTTAGLNLANTTLGFGERLTGAQNRNAQLEAINASQPSLEDKIISGIIGGGSTTLFTSDENVKHDVQKFDESNVLEKLADLNIDTWRYNEEEGLGTDVHVGPMAQEFKRVFGVGDGKTIAMVDVVGIMLASQKH